MPRGPDNRPAYARYKSWAKEEAIPLDGVTLVPQRSDIKSRSSVDTSTHLMRNVYMRIPVMGANMDTIMNPILAIEMAKNGAIGVLPRFNSIESQADDVKRVKREFRMIIEHPFSLSDSLSVGEAKKILDRENVGGALVKNGENKVIGMITMRDVILAKDDSIPVSDRMKPKDKLITAPLGVDISAARDILDENRIEKLPLVDENGEIVAIMTTRGILDKENNTTATKDKDGRLAVAAAVGIHTEDMERVQELIHQGADGIVVDIAHGDSDGEVEMITKIKKAYPNIWVAGGNVVTEEGAKSLIDAGADAIKVGVGPGSFCTTREVTGHGDGQFSATIEVANITHKKGVVLITDGGIESSGHIVKALAAGADAVMAGTLFLGAEESSGIRVRGRDGVVYKMGRGNASRESENTRITMSGRRNVRSAPEGITAQVPYYGPVSTKLLELHQGIQSGLSYSGAHDIKELQRKARFKRAGIGYDHESRPRALDHGGYS